MQSILYKYSSINNNFWFLQNNSCDRKIIHLTRIVFLWQEFYSFDTIFTAKGHLSLWLKVYLSNHQFTHFWKKMYSFGRDSILLTGNLFLWYQFISCDKNFILVKVFYSCDISPITYLQAGLAPTESKLNIINFTIFSKSRHCISRMIITNFVTHTKTFFLSKW